MLGVFVLIGGFLLIYLIVSFPLFLPYLLGLLVFFWVVFRLSKKREPSGGYSSYLSHDSLSSPCDGCTSREDAE